MTYAAIVTEVALEMGVPDEVIENAKAWASMTVLHGRKLAQTELSENDEHIVRMYFRTLLYRMITDPEYRRELRRELKRKIERN